MDSIPNCKVSEGEPRSKLTLSLPEFSRRCEALGTRQPTLFHTAQQGDELSSGPWLQIPWDTYVWVHTDAVHTVGLFHHRGTLCVGNPGRIKGLLENRPKFCPRGWLYLYHQAGKQICPLPQNESLALSSKACCYTNVFEMLAWKKRLAGT